MFNPNNLINEYHKLQQHEQEVQRATSGNAPPPASHARDAPTFNPLQLLAYLSQLDLTNPPPALKKSLTNPIVLVALAVFAYIVISLLTKILFIAVIAGAAYFFFFKGNSSSAGPQEDVVGKRPPFSSTPSNSSPYPSPGFNQQQPQAPSQEQPKDLASFLWQKGVPAGVEIAQTFLSKRKRQEATREVRTNNDD
ncbi:hypothetical protein JCM11491_006902 [Sporobolomyces phaffii]